MCFHRLENQGKGSGHWLTESLEEVVQGAARESKETSRVKPNGEGTENGKKGSKKTIFSCSTFAQDQHAGACRTKTKSNTDKGPGNWESRGGMQEPLLPGPYACLFIYCLACSYHPLLWKNLNYVHMVCCVNERTLTNF